MSYKYKSVKFRYTRDNNSVIIRTQRLFLDSNGNELTPVLQVLLDKQVLSQYKTDKTENSNLRHFLVYKIVNNEISTFKVFIPDRPGTNNFKIALLQMRNFNDVECFDYIGERFSNG